MQNEPGLFSPHRLCRVLLYLGSILTSLLFLVVNLTCAMLIHGEVPEKQLRWTVLARALLNDSLFILCAISLACCMCKLGKMSSANVYLESKVGKCLGNSHWHCWVWVCSLRAALAWWHSSCSSSSSPSSGGVATLDSSLSRSACSCCGRDVSCIF